MRSAALLGAASLACAAAQEALVGRWSSTHIPGSAPAARRAAASADAALGAGAVSGGGWPTEHHDTQNSGATQYLGPISSGECVVPFFGLGESTPLRFYATGVTAGTPGANAHFFGGSDNALRVVVKNATIVLPGTSVSTALTVSTCPLAPLRRNASAAAAEAYGLVASGTTWTASDGVTDRLALASADGTVYALNWQSCVANASICTTNTSTVTPNSYGAGAPAPPCVAWTFTSPADSATGFPFLSPPRSIYATNISTTLVLVTDTAKGGLNTGATTYALRGETGALLWSHKHAAVNGTWYGSFGAVPAFDAVDNIVFLAYGPGVVALHGSTGVVLGRWGGAGDLVAASPTIIVPDNGAGAWSIFLHTSLGTLWQLQIAYAGAGQEDIVFTPVWKCDYDLATYWRTGAGTCTTFSSTSGAAAAAAALAAAAQEVVEVPLSTGAGAGAGTFAALRGDFGVGGGFPQPTTPAQRAALWASIHARYHAAFPSGPATPLRAEHTAGLPQGVDTRALEASLMLAALPPAQAAAVRSGEDWAGHASAAVAGYALHTPLQAQARRAALLGEDYSSSYPYATPSLVSLGQLALAQFTAMGGSPTGLFVVSTVTGSVTWAYGNTTLKGAFGTSLLLNFGRSRATPAIDGNGNMFASSDSTIPTIPGDTIPYSLAFQRAGLGYAAAPSWAVNLGQAQVNLLGSASPVVRAGLIADQPEVYSASFQGVSALVAGVSCPVVGGFECGPSSAAADGSLVQGSCNCATGVCSCPRGVGFACRQGSGCGDTCNGNGRCSEANVSGVATAQCACSACWGGQYCSVPTCSSGAAATPFLRTPAGAAAVGVPVALALALVLALAWWRVVHPKAPWAEALPRCLRGSSSESGSALLGSGEDESVGDRYKKGGYGSVARTEA